MIHLPSNVCSTISSICKWLIWSFATGQLLKILSFYIYLNFFSILFLYSIGEGNGTPLQYSCLENPMDGGAWWAAVHGVAKSPTRLSDFTFTFHFHALEKEMVTHSSVLAWRIPGTEGPGRRPSVGSQRVGPNWSDLAAAATVFILSVIGNKIAVDVCSIIFQWIEL